MAYRNSVITINGFIGKTIDKIEYGKNNKPRVRFSVGVSNQKFDGGTVVQWYQVLVFGDRALGLIKEKRIQRGWQAVIHGLHSYSPYRDKNGYTKFSNSIFADWEVINTAVLSSKRALDDIDKVREIDEQITEEDIADLEAPF